MRISDWSSDVCSSDLTHLEHHGIGCGLSGFRSRQALHCSTGCGIRQKRTFREVIRLRSRKLPVREMVRTRSEEHTSELQSLMRISYAVLCLIKTYVIISVLFIIRIRMNMYN